jgi:hypothetical protein
MLSKTIREAKNVKRARSRRRTSSHAHAFIEAVEPLAPKHPLRPVSTAPWA